MFRLLLSVVSARTCCVFHIKFFFFCLRANYIFGFIFMSELNLWLNSPVTIPTILAVSERRFRLYRCYYSDYDSPRAAFVREDRVTRCSKLNSFDSRRQRFELIVIQCSEWQRTSSRCTLFTCGFSSFSSRDKREIMCVNLRAHIAPCTPYININKFIFRIGDGSRDEKLHEKINGTKPISGRRE